MSVKITRRNEWGMKPTSLGPPLQVVPWEAWLHHSVTPLTTDWVADMKFIEDVGVERFGRFSYSWCYHALTRRFIEAEGSFKGAHTQDRNSFSLGIVLVGNFQNEELTDEGVADIAEGLDFLEDTGRLVKGVYPTGGHRDLKSTACPGEHAYLRIDDIRDYRPAPPPAPTPTPEEDDMRASLSWLLHKDRPEGGAALYLVHGNTAAHVNGSDAKAIAIARGAVPDTSTREKPHDAEVFLRSGIAPVLDGPLKGL